MRRASYSYSRKVHWTRKFFLVFSTDCQIRLTGWGDKWNRRQHLTFLSQSFLLCRYALPCGITDIEQRKNSQWMFALKQQECALGFGILVPRGTRKNPILAVSMSVFFLSVLSFYVASSWLDNAVREVKIAREAEVAVHETTADFQLRSLCPVFLTA